MYVGNTADGSGLHHLIWTVVGNVVDQHLMRCATEVRVEVTEDGWVVVRDDGPGISIDIARRSDRPVLEYVLTRLNTWWPAFDGYVFRGHPGVGMHGVGLAMVNALSTRLEVTTTRNSIRWTQAFERGEVASELRSLGPTKLEGTAILFRPDPEIFGTIELDLARIGDRLQQIAWLNPLLRVFWQERRLSGRGGLRGWVASLGTVESLVSTSHVVDGILVDLALGWGATPGTTLRSFVNMHETMDGSHVDGIWRALHDSIGGSISRTELQAALGPGLVGIVHVGLDAPSFRGRCRNHLENPEAEQAVRKLVEAELSRGVRVRDFLRRRVGQ